MIKTIRNNNLNESEEELSETDILVKNFNPYAVQYEGNYLEGYSVLIKDRNSNYSFWVDVTISDEDVSCDWNKYIFDMNNSNDIQIKLLQENTDIFDLCTSTAIEYLQQKELIFQDSNGDWGYTSVVEDESDDEIETKITKDLYENKHWYVVYLSSDGHTKNHTLDWFQTETEAQKFVDAYDNIFVDDIGFEWDLIIDTEDTTEKSLLDRQLVREDDKYYDEPDDIDDDFGFNPYTGCYDYDE